VKRFEELMMSLFGFRGSRSALAILLAFALVPSPCSAQRPPSEGTGGAAGYSPPPLDMPRSVEPMNAPPMPADAAPADTVPESDASAPGEDIPDDGGNQPPAEATGADQPK
jgi:hypothetical protein